MVFYYLIYPLVFFKKYPWTAALGIYLVSYFVLQLNLPVTADVLRLYQMHFLSFPLGAALACLVVTENPLKLLLSQKIKDWADYLNKFSWLKNFLYLVISALLLYVIIYTGYHSGVGEAPDKIQVISLTTCFAMILLFVMNTFEFRLVSLVGLYSFEIYLIHWPLMSRYDLLFKFLPGWLAMLLYLFIFLSLGWLLQNLLKPINKTPKLL